MLKELKRLLCLSSSLLLFASCNNKYSGNFVVIETDRAVNFNACNFVIGNQTFVIKNIRTYTNGKLVRYQGCTDDGLYTEDFKKGSTYSTEDEAVEKLSISRKKDSINYFDKTFKVINQNKDSTVIEFKKDIYLIFIGEIPNQ